MLGSERQRVILRRVQQNGAVRVAQLARELDVAEETIRRDLERLDLDGKLVRTHGGAVPLEPDRELPYVVRETANLPAKRAIAAIAARHIRDGDVIALDASSTAIELARAMPHVPLTVLTNSLVGAMVLAARPHARVILTGGVLDAPSMSFVGSLAEDALTRFHINKLFLSTKGVDAQRGLSVASNDHARIKRRMIDLADETFLLADRSKFGVKSVEFFAQVEDIDVIITDVEPSAELSDEFARRAVRVQHTMEPGGADRAAQSFQPSR